MGTTGDSNNQAWEIDEDVIRQWIRRNLPRINSEEDVNTLASAWWVKIQYRYPSATVGDLDGILRELWSNNGTALQDLIRSHLPPGG